MVGRDLHPTVCYLSWSTSLTFSDTIGDSTYPIAIMRVYLFPLLPLLRPVGSDHEIPASKAGGFTNLPRAQYVPTDGLGPPNSSFRER